MNFNRIVKVNEQTNSNVSRETRARFLKSQICENYWTL